MTLQNAISNIDSINRSIELSRLSYNPHHIVKLVGVSKYNTAQEVATLYKAGQRAFGENKIQDLKIKMDELYELPIEWHFIGHLQTNKINQLIELEPFLMHSLDSYDLAYELDKRLKIKNKTMNCLMQVNSSLETTKGGILPDEAINIYKKIRNNFTNIKLVGIMSIGANCDDIKIIENSFKTTKNIFDSLKPYGANICSMGMSSDYNLAITNGSNMIRIGSSLFKNK